MALLLLAGFGRGGSGSGSGSGGGRGRRPPGLRGKDIGLYYASLSKRKSRQDEEKNVSHLLLLVFSLNSSN